MLIPVISAFLKKSKSKQPKCSAVIAAAGLSQRLNGEDKILYKINNKPVLAHTLEAFQKNALISEIVIVSREEQFKNIAEICADYGIDKVSMLMTGGPTRLESVRNGVFAVSDKAKIIAIHDGARPCIDEAIIKNTINAAIKHHAAAPAIPAVSTIKKVDKGVISETIDRDGLFEIQTPQVFRAELIKAALTNAVNKSINVTDDCMAVELIGVPVHITEGSRNNIKLTSKEDFSIAEALLAGKE